MIAVLPWLSIAFGWIYTISWSLSFYPQPLLNWQRRSTSGTTIDFPTINVLGFLAYFTSNAAFLYSSTIRRQYAERNRGFTPTVQFNDLAFAGHAVILSIITYSQFYAGLWGFDRNPRGGRISKSILGIFFGSLLGVGIVVLIVLGKQGGGDDVDAASSWAWIDVIYAISYVKLFITLIKYTPQIITNYRNRSTIGWSIYQILFDFAGGLLSITQLGIDSYLQHDWSGITGNPVKLALGNISMFFDIVFMTQHYILYRGSRAEEQDPLLEGDRESRIE